uniref:Uncharacterized protein n=1 Tax=Avena sativa TaxID=4498 RepID=A0ACD5VYY2_AVESA
MEDALPPPVSPAPLAGGAAAPTILFLTRRRSHLDSASYRTLSRLFSHCLHLHPQQHAVPAHPEVETAAANPIGDDSSQGGSVPFKDTEFEHGKDVEEEPAGAITSVPETPAPSVVVEATAGNPIADLDVASQGPAEHEVAGVERAEGVQDMVVVGRACRETGALVEAEFVGADEVLRTMKACLEGEVEESVEVAVVNDDENLLPNSLVVEDASGGTASVQNYGVCEGESWNDGKIAEGVTKLGAGVEEDRPVGDSDHHSVDADGFEEGEIEGDLQDLNDESDNLEHQEADDEKLEEDCVTRGSGENESSGHDLPCLDLCSTPKVKGTDDLILNKEDNIKSDALMHVSRAQVVSYDEIVEWNETPVHDAEAPRGGKRKQYLSEERKAKKTKNKRVKRAQQRVADGVKRLKLAPVMKPKVVQYCHFYLHGKCQQVPTADGPSKSDAKKSDVSLLSEKTTSIDQTSSQKALAVHDGQHVASTPTKPNSILKNLAGISVNAQKASAHTPKGVQFRPCSKGISDSSTPQQNALPTEKHIYTNGGKYKDFGGPQAAEGDPNRQSSAPLFDEKNSFEKISSYPKKTLPTYSTAVLGSVSTQHEVSEASRILQEFLFGAGS